MAALPPHVPLPALPHLDGDGSVGVTHDEQRQEVARDHDDDEIGQRCCSPRYGADHPW